MSIRLFPLEKSANRFTLQPVLIEYLTERLVAQIIEEIRSGEINLFNAHALLKTSVSDYVRNIQSRLFLQPMGKKLLEIYGNQARLEERLKEILSFLRESARFPYGYAAGNILNLLCSLGTDIRGYDFSSLIVWQAYPQGVDLPEVNFAYANLANSVFTDTFGSTLSVALNLQLIAAGTTKGEIRFWDAASGFPFRTFQGHIDWVSSVAFSPDGTILASSGYDGIINLWDSQTYTCLRKLRSDRPYEQMNITQVKGLTEGQKATLRSLGAIEDNNQGQS
jgi:WD40 repeat protein